MSLLIDNGRLTIGLNTFSLGSYSELFCKEIYSICKKKNLNLIIFPDYSEHRLNHYLTSDIYDIGYKKINKYINTHNIDGLISLFHGTTTDNNKLWLLHEKQGLPIVNANSIIKGIPSIVIDNTAGIRDAMEHLITEHGYRRIAYIKGIEGLEHTIARYNAYLEMLEKHNIPFNPEIVEKGEYSIPSGRIAGMNLLKQLGNFDVILSSNDEMVIGVVQVFQENGIKIPEEVKIMGFDYIKPFQHEFCPIATVRQPVNEIAETAIEYVLKLINNESVPPVTFVKPVIIKRPSCGCDYVQINYKEKMHTELLKIGDKEDLDITIIDRIHRLTSMELKNLICTISNELPFLYIDNFFMSLYYPNDIILSDEVIPDASLSKLLLCYTENKLDENFGEILFNECNILPDGIIKSDRSLSMIVSPLSFKETDYGTVFFEMPGANLANFEYLRRQLCSSLKNIFLIEQLNRTQSDLVHAEKMASLGNLVAGIAHEINTPIGVGVSAASYAEDNASKILANYLEGTLKKSDFVKYLETNIETDKIILQNLKRASDIITSFKNISVDQSSEKKRNFYVLDYIEQIILSLKPRLKRTPHKVEVICDETIEITSYPGALSQILSNLILNSIIHAFEPETIGIIQIEFYVISNSRVKLIYSDNGVGIKPEHINNIFDPFFTTKRGTGGTGLGLNIVYNIVKEKLKGKISCRSTIGQGVRFELEWPIVKS